MKRKGDHFPFVLVHQGIHPFLAKRQAILEVCELENKSELQSFLVYFIPIMSTLASPLNQLMSKDSPSCWRRECQALFQALKDTLASLNVLAHYNPKLEVQLAVHASPEAL